MNEKVIFRLASASIGTRLRNREVLKYWRRRPKWVVDFGCGAGVFCRDLMKAGVSPIGMEYDYDKALIARRNLNVPFFTGDITQLPLKDGSIPVALVRDVLEHLDNDVQALLELKRCLRPGGILLITVPNRNWRFFYKFGKMRSEDHGHLRLYDKIEFVKRLRDFNFVVEKAEHLQNPIATLFEFLLIKAELLVFGKEKVQQSKMSQGVSSKPWLTMLYKLTSHLVWPFIVISEYIFPKNLGSELLIIAFKQ